MALVVGIGAWQTRHHPRGPVPDFALTQLGTGGVVTAQSLAGRPTLLVFWAPWCGVCKAESSNVSWARRLVGDRARVVSIVAAYDSLAEVQRAVEAQHMDYPVLLGDDAVTGRFAVRAFPAAFFLDEAGRIRNSTSGYTTTLGLVWRLLSPL